MHCAVRCHQYTTPMACLTRINELGLTLCCLVPHENGEKGLEHTPTFDSVVRIYRFGCRLCQTADPAEFRWRLQDGVWQSHHTCTCGFRPGATSEYFESWLTSHKIYEHYGTNAMEPRDKLPPIPKPERGQKAPAPPGVFITRGRMQKLGGFDMILARLPEKANGKNFGYKKFYAHFKGKPPRDLARNVPLAGIPKVYRNAEQREKVREFWRTFERALVNLPNDDKSFAGGWAPGNHPNDQRNRGRQPLPQGRGVGVQMGANLKPPSANQFAEKKYQKPKFQGKEQGQQGSSRWHNIPAKDPPMKGASEISRKRDLSSSSNRNRSLSPAAKRLLQLCEGHYRTGEISVFLDQVTEFHPPGVNTFPGLQQRLWSAKDPIVVFDDSQNCDVKIAIKSARVNSCG